VDVRGKIKKRGETPLRHPACKKGVAAERGASPSEKYLPSPARTSSILEQFTRLERGSGVEVISTIKYKLFYPALRGFPVDVLEERRDIVRPLQAVISDEGVLEDVHDEDGPATSQVASVVFVNPCVE
jgi:hypothetical protein